MEVSSDEEQQTSLVGSSTKKRKVTGRLSEVNKKLRLQSHEQGPDCRCKRFKCFSIIPIEERSKILAEFNRMESWNVQSAYLAGLISITPVVQRRPRLPEEDSSLRTASYHYRVRFSRDNSPVEVPVCLKAFISIHGITRRRIETIHQALQLTGQAPKDKRGKHVSKYRKLSKKTEECVCHHIKLFKGRTSHYSSTRTKKIYLPEELNIKKMHTMYQTKYPNNRVSYETYRTIFNTKFNIAFGYPRSDTCSSCDQFIARIKVLNTKHSETASLEEKDKISREIRQLTTENELHKKKANTFYVRKKNARLYSRTHVDVEAICMDFQKNLPLPNITTNDVYYKRQLSFYSFNIHRLSDAHSVFYTYTEQVACKGANEVCSFLHHYVNEYLPPQVKHLKIFCDSCGGQNKNFTLFRYLHHLVHKFQRFETVTVVFPIRGHSYMECDKNMGIINCKTRAELPEDWVDIFRTARDKPTPFHVEEVDQSLVRDWTKFLEPLYMKKCPFLSRPIRELEVSHQHPRIIRHRDSYNGMWVSSTVTETRKKRPQGPALAPNEFLYPMRAYNGKLLSQKPLGSST